MIHRADRYLIGAGPSKRRIVELGDLEQQYARQAVEYYSSGMLFGGVSLECDAAFLKRQLPVALRVLQKQHPTLRCTLGKTSQNVYTYEEYPEMVIFIDYRPRNGNAQAWQRVWQEEFEAQHAQLGGPCLRVIVFTDDTEQQHELALAVDHFVCDGTSFSYLLHELMYNLGCCITPDDVEWGAWEQPWEDTKLLCEKYPRALPMYAGKYVKSAVDMISVIAARDITALPFAPGHDGFQLLRTARQMVDASRTHVINHQLSKEDTRVLLERCRAEKSTVTSAVASAFAAGQQEAIRAWRGGKPSLAPLGSTLSVMVSMRNGRTVNPINLAPHVSNIHMNVYQASAAPAELWHASRALYAEMKRFTEEDKLWNSKHTVTFMSTLPSGQNLVRMPNLAVSSWGSNAVQDCYGSTVRIREGFFAQNARQVSVPTLSLNNIVCGKLNIVLLAPTPRFDPNMLDDAFQRGVKNLQAMVTDIAKL